MPIPDQGELYKDAWEEELARRQRERIPTMPPPYEPPISYPVSERAIIEEPFLAWQHMDEPSKWPWAPTEEALEYMETVPMEPHFTPRGQKYPYSGGERVSLPRERGGGYFHPEQGTGRIELVGQPSQATTLHEMGHAMVHRQPWLLYGFAEAARESEPELREAFLGGELERWLDMPGELYVELPVIEFVRGIPIPPALREYYPWLEFPPLPIPRSEWH